MVASPDLVFDLKSVRERLEGDDELIREIVSIFLADSRKYLEQIEAHLVNSEFTLLARVAHSLRGAAANVGANVVGWLAGELERGCSSAETQAEAILMNLKAAATEFEIEASKFLKP